MFNSDDSSIHLSFLGCDPAANTDCTGYNLDDGTPYALRPRFGRLNLQTGILDPIKEISSHFGAAGSIAISPKGTPRSESVVYFGGAIDIGRRTSMS